MKPIGLVPELYCSDLQKTLDFYVGILGFEIVYERKDEGFAYCKKGNAEMMFEQLGESRNWITGELEHPYGRGINFQIQVQSVKLLHDVIHAHNITPFLAPEEKWYRKGEVMLGQQQFMVKDPDGYLLRFYQDLGIRPY